MKTYNARDQRITLYRRFLHEANATPLLSAAQERQLARRIDTGRRRLLAALAVWPCCIPDLLTNYAAAGATARQRQRIITGLQDDHPEIPAFTVSTARIATQLAELDEAHRLHLNSLAVNGWEHAQTRLRRKAMAARLCGLRLHEHYLHRLLVLTETDPSTQTAVPYARLRARIAAARRVLDDDKQHLVTANLRLVASVARRYRYCEMAQVDLLQEGNLGLLRAAEKFDYRRGCKFSTYAIWWIQRAMVLAITLQRSALSVPAYALQAAHRAQRRTAQQLLLGEPAPSMDELARHEAMAAPDLRAAYAACLPVMSLHGEAGDDSAPINTLHDSGQTDPADILMQADLRQQLQGALTRLPERQALVLRLRYGIGVDEPHTLDAIGRQLGLSRERIRQIEEQALNRLRTDTSRASLAQLLDEPRVWSPQHRPTDDRLRDGAA